MRTIKREQGRTTVQVSRSELSLLTSALELVSSDTLIPDWEFPTRMGASVAAGRQLLREIREATDEMDA